MVFYDIFPLICISLAVGLLVWMSAIDLKHWILPDELNAALGICGIVFHVVTAYEVVSLFSMIGGAVGAAGLLYVIRFFANRHYGRDSLGLGDVKLLGAAGFWLGVEGVMQAITIGAFAGLIHGVLFASYISIRQKTPFTIRNLAIPAGPGFAVGIAAAGAILLNGFVRQTLHALIS